MTIETHVTVIGVEYLKPHRAETSVEAKKKEVKRARS